MRGDVGIGDEAGRPAGRGRAEGEASRRAAGGRTGRAAPQHHKVVRSCIRERENLSAMIPSISSICLILC